MAKSDLLESDVYIAGLLGQVEQRPGYRVIKTLDNPGFYFGNLLVLDEAPQTMEPWLQVFEREFDAEVRHRCFAWEAGALSEPLLESAKALELEPDYLVEMKLHCLAEHSATGEAAWTARRLQPSSDWAAMVELFEACKELGFDTDEVHRLFNERTLKARRRWLEQGQANWWGIFDGDQLVGQCGMVFCGEVGRFQDVETHPAYRRRGICSTLIRAVAQDALENQHVSRLVLAAEVDGPALALYRRLGFRETGRCHSLVRHASALQIRRETVADHAGVRSMVRAAFGSSEESKLLDVLRSKPGAISLVALRSGHLLGQVLFSSIALLGAPEPFTVAALVPLSVRPEAQGRGVGTQLVEQGLAQCRAAGFSLCMVLGSPKYYGRFGFQPAVALGFSNPFTTEDSNFLVKELKPGALEEHTGSLDYGPHFSKWCKASRLERPGRN